MKPKFFKLAKNISLKSPSKYKLGCVITQKNKVISIGWNDMRRTHPKSKAWGNFIHAELHALIGLTYQETKGASVYVYRENTMGQLAKSRPCRVCYNALQQAGVKKLFYTTDNGYGKEKI